MISSVVLGPRSLGHPHGCFISHEEVKLDPKSPYQSPKAALIDWSTSQLPIIREFLHSESTAKGYQRDSEHQGP